MTRSDTSWEGVHDWYDSLVGREGHYYHQHVILPGIERLFSLTKESSLLDIACGQGVLARSLPAYVPYTGIDMSKGLIQAAKQHARGSKNREFLVGDATKPLPLPKTAQFTHATCILALQNIENAPAVFQNVYAHLKPNGEFLFVLNHPCFRIPRHSQWHFDDGSKSLSRQMRSYMSSQKIPISMRPGKGPAEATISFHHPLTYYVSALKEAGFVVTAIEEWCSDKTSTGSQARVENRARKEFPLFLTIVARKI